VDGVDVTFEVSGDLLALPEGQTTILAEKLRLFAAGQFRHEVRKLEKLGTSRAWLAGTREAADLIEMALVDERSGPVRLVGGDVADAVFQVMRLSYPDSSDRAGAAGLAEALEALSEPRDWGLPRSHCGPCAQNGGRRHRSFPSDKKPGDADHRIRSGGWGAELTVDLKAGKYILLCNLPGHYTKAKQYAAFTAE
jgi:hypothetical protein